MAVQFNEANYGAPRARAPKYSWPTKLVLKLGLAKDEKQAALILIVIALLAVGAAFFFLQQGIKTPPPPDTRTLAG